MTKILKELISGEWAPVAPDYGPREFDRNGTHDIGWDYYDKDCRCWRSIFESDLPCDDNGYLVFEPEWREA